MRRSELAIWLAPAMLLAGCTTAGRVEPDGAAGTYRVSESASPIAGGAKAAQRLALSEARRFCTARDGALRPLAMQRSGDTLAAELFSYGTFTMRFQCITSADSTEPPVHGEGTASND